MITSAGALPEAEMTSWWSLGFVTKSRTINRFPAFRQARCMVSITVPYQTAAGVWRQVSH